MLCLSDPERFTFTDTTSNVGTASCPIAAGPTDIASTVTASSSLISFLISRSHPYNAAGDRTVNRAR